MSSSSIASPHGLTILLTVLTNNIVVGVRDVRLYVDSYLGACTL